MRPAIAIALVACAVIAGCGAPAGRLREGGPGVISVPPPQARAAAQAARDRVHVGDTRQQVASALGPSNFIAFGSGWQVWVYRWPGADGSTRDATELVVLFDPAGTVRKARVRFGHHGSA